MSSNPSSSHRWSLVDRLTRRSLIWGVGGSLLFHFITISVVMFGEFHGWIAERPQFTPTVPVPPVRRPSPAILSPAIQTPSFTLVTAPPPAQEISTELVRSRLDEIVADAKKKSPTENLDKLDRLSNRLNNVSTDKSLDDLTGWFQQWMGLEQRSTEVQQAKSLDDFDSDTAQLNDVVRTRKPDGGWKYVAQLIDKHGQTVSVEMGDIDGRAAYELMQKLKSNPLLEKVYRRLAMPLMDSLVPRIKRDASATPARQVAEKPPHPSNSGGQDAAAP